MKRLVAALFALAVGSLAFGSSQEGLKELVFARIRSFLAEDTAALAGGYAAGAESFFAGAPLQGFFQEDLTAPWAALFGEIDPISAGKLNLHLIGEANTAVAEFALRATRGEELVSFPVIWGMVFSGEEVIREDFLIPLVGAIPAVDGAVSEGEYPHAVAAAGVEFHWMNGTVLLFGALVSPGTGWVAVGFDPEYRMEGANIVFAWVTDGEVSMEDHYGTGPTSHGRDFVSHILLSAGTEAGGSTTVEFVVPLNSGDPQDKVLERGKAYTVILAYHRSSDGFRRHTARGQAEIDLD